MGKVKIVDLSNTYMRKDYILFKKKAFGRQKRTADSVHGS